MDTKNQFIFAIALSASLLLGCASRSPHSSDVVSGTSTALDQPVSQNTEPSIPLADTPALDDCILYALRESSDLKAAFALYQAALERAPQVSALPEPRLSYGYFVNAIETRSGPMRHRVGVAQPIPWFGTLTLKEEIATAEAEAAYYSFLTRKNRVVFEVVKAFYELAYLSEAKMITEANLELLKRWEQVLAQRYRSQAGSQADLIKVQVELGKLEDTLRELNELKHPLQAELNAHLNRPVQSQISLGPQVLQSKLSANTLSLLSVSKESLETALTENNPEIKLLGALVNARAQGIELAEKAFYPDFSLGADYTVIGEREQAGSDSGDDGLAAVFSVSVPINFSKYRAARREAQQRGKAAEELLLSKKLQLSSSLARALFDLSDSKRRIALYEQTLVPKAEEALESTFTAFESGESSFLDLLDTERQYLDFQIMLSRSRADLAIRESELRALLGDYSDDDSSFTGGEK